jgi:predicted dehydrogenase
MATLGIGIIGTGGISRAHVAGYRKLGDAVRLVAVADIDLGRARAAADEWGVEHAFSDRFEPAASHATSVAVVKRVSLPLGFSQRSARLDC